MLLLKICNNYIEAWKKILHDNKKAQKLQEKDYLIDIVYILVPDSTKKCVAQYSTKIIAK